MFLRHELRRALEFYRYHLPALGLLLDTFELNNYKYALVGGFVKAIVAFCTKVTNRSYCRDLDIIVDLPKDEIEHLLKTYHIKYSKNDFNGFKIVDRKDASFDMDIDLWSLEDHEPFKALPCELHNWKGVRKSGWLSVCGGTWLPQSNKLYIKGLKKAIKTKTVEFYYPEYYFGSNLVTNKYTVVAKIIELIRDGWNLDKHCKLAVKQYLDRHKDLKTLVGYLEDHSKDCFTDYEELVLELKKQL